MRLAVLDNCADARQVVYSAWAKAFRPKVQLRVSEWAEQNRHVSDKSGSRYPGEWRNDRTPHLVEIMDALGPQDPCADVVFKKSAQVGGSEVGLNFLGYIIDHEPGPTMVVLPSILESGKFGRIKLNPTIEATPCLAEKVEEQKERSGDGSTREFKAFRGGFIQMTYAGSSKGLQMVTAKYTFADELSEWPYEAGERGAPDEQLEARTDIYEGEAKRLWISTPSLVGTCRISERYDASDKRQRYVPCPECGAYQVLKFSNLKRESDQFPHHAYFECAANKCRIGPEHKRRMIACGEWIATAGDDAPGDWFPADELDKWKSRDVPQSLRTKGYSIWKAYSLFVSWDSIVASFLAATTSQQLKVFTQQTLGEAYEERGDAPDSERLHTQRRVNLRLGVVPPDGPVVFTGGVDVQSNRIEWAIWGWSEGVTRWLIDKGIVEGDPASREVWLEFDRRVILRELEMPSGASLPVDLWCIDSGYQSQMVYDFCRSRPRCYAVDGRKGRSHPFMGTPKTVDLTLAGKRIRNGAMLWPVGGYALKVDLYGAIRKTIVGPDEHDAMMPGAMILPGDLDLAYCEQLTSEQLKRVERKSGLADYEWQVLAGRANEALDKACYARAGAEYLEVSRLGVEDWQRLRAERGTIASNQGAGTDDLFSVKVARTTGEIDRTEAPSTGRQRGIRGGVNRG